MTKAEIKALAYVRKTNGGASRAHFLEEHMPIGCQLWEVIAVAGLVRTDERGRIYLTEAGTAALTRAR